MTTRKKRPASLIDDAKEVAPKGVGRRIKKAPVLKDRDDVIDIEESVVGVEKPKKVTSTKKPKVEKKPKKVAKEVDPTELLSEIVPRYYENNEAKKRFTKLASDDNKVIKETMLNIDLDEFEVDGIKATVTERTTSGYDQAILLETIKELGVPGVIKTKEYVDMVALESAIQGGEVDANDLAKTITSSTSQVLNIKKA